MKFKTLLAMMSRILFFISFFSSFCLLAQKKHFDLEWNDEIVYRYGDYIETIPGFDKLHTNYDNSSGLFYINQWEEAGKINPRTIKISNVSYETIPKSYLKDLKTATIPDKIDVVVKTATARGLNSGFLKISPIIKENGVYKKIKSFDLRYGVTNDLANKLSVSSRLAVTNSVLASGDWYRFVVSKTGVHRITPDFLSNLGINLSGVDPRTIKIYGHGGKPLPLLNSLNTDFDIPEIAIQVTGGDDGSFSGNDAILFYGEDTFGFVDENESFINPYEDKSYYYITYGGSLGKRITSATQPTGAATTQITSYKSLLFKEDDLVTIYKTGRKWLGDKFDVVLSRDYDMFNFPEIVPNTSFDINVRAAATTATSSKMDVLVGNEFVGTLNFSRSSSVGNITTESVLSEEFLANGPNPVITIKYDQMGNPSSEAYLDYISVTGVVPLKGYGKQFIFSNGEEINADVGEYTISNTTNISAIWDVTVPKEVSLVASNSGASVLSFKSLLATTKKYVALDTSDFYTPIVPENARVSNQNLKGAVFRNEQGSFEDLDYLIVTNNDLLSAANRLATFHRTNNNLNAKVVTLDMVYNEFSSGKRDIGAIRNFVRYIYENGSTPENRIKYLCLLGDTSVDHKNSRLNVNNNIVPTYEPLNSYNVRSSFMTDDYFVMLDPEEGVVNDSEKLDLAVGRMLVDTPANANAMVDKVIEYYAKSSFGSWRNKHLYISDDVDEAWEKTIQLNLNNFADKIDTILPSSNFQKIHMDAFRQESIQGGKRFPEVNKTMLNALESGVLVASYFGHGGEEGLAKERIFTKSDAENLQNTSKYPLFITITCNFTKFDNPERTTAGELMYLNPKGGAISMITTTREIGVQAGIDINGSLIDFLFPINEEYTSIAQSLVDTKNNITSSFSRRDSRAVFFIGDPAMKLAIPKRQVRLTKINDVPIGSADIESLQALSRVKLSGEVFIGNDTVDDYNGILSVVVYDKKEQRTTLANDNITDGGGVIKLTFDELGGVIFKGKISIKNGVFDVEFVAPRDIKIPVGTGRVSFYAENSDLEEDQSGRDDTILIGGINENAPEDVKGPDLELFLNDENFVSGGVVNNSPILIAKLQDENGINTSSGIGHDIIAIIDGDEANPIVLSDFYETALDDFTTGSLNFKLRDLEPGTHTLSVRAWDVYNNSTTQELEFVVLEDGEFIIENVLNYPNPLINYTEFWFSHNNPEATLLDVQVQVFTVSGKLIWTRNQTVSGKRTYQNDISWDGRDDFGDRVGKGVYVYKISVKSTLTNKTVEKFEKLVIL